VFMCKKVYLFRSLLRCLFSRRINVLNLNSMTYMKLIFILIALIALKSTMLDLCIVEEVVESEFEGQKTGVLILQTSLQAKATS